jgi:CRP-like cAMP-binding protein
MECIYAVWRNLWATNQIRHLNRRDFDPKKFLATIGEGRKVVAFPKKQTIFSQGDAADAVFYIQDGRVFL